MSTSQRTPNTDKIKVNNSIDRYGDKNRVNSSNFNATILKFSVKFDHPFSHVFIFGNMFPESHGFVAVPVTRANNFVSLYACNRHSNETMTLRIHVSKYKSMRKWMFEFLRKFENRGIIVLITKSILNTKSINLLLFTLILYVENFYVFYGCPYSVQFYGCPYSGQVYGCPYSGQFNGCPYSGQFFCVLAIYGVTWFMQLYLCCPKPNNLRVSILFLLFVGLFE